MVKRKKTKGQTMIYKMLSLLVILTIYIFVNYGRSLVFNTAFNWLSNLLTVSLLVECYSRNQATIFQLFRHCQFYKLINEGRGYPKEKLLTAGCK